MKHIILCAIGFTLLLASCKKEQIQPRNTQNATSGFNTTTKAASAIIRRGKVKKKTTLGYKVSIVTNDNGHDPGVTILDILSLSQGAVEGPTTIETNEFQTLANGRKKIVFDNINFVDIGELSVQNPVYATLKVTQHLSNGTVVSETIELPIEPAGISYPVAKQMTFTEKEDGSVEARLIIDPNDLEIADNNGGSIFLGSGSTVTGKYFDAAGMQGVVAGHAYTLQYLETTAKGNVIFTNPNVAVDGGYNPPVHFRFGKGTRTATTAVAGKPELLSLSPGGGAPSIPLTPVPSFQTKEKTIATHSKWIFPKIDNSGNVDLIFPVYEKAHTPSNSQIHQVRIEFTDYSGPEPIPTEITRFIHDANGDGIEDELSENPLTIFKFLDLEFEDTPGEGEEYTIIIDYLNEAGFSLHAHETTLVIGTKNTFN